MCINTYVLMENQAFHFTNSIWYQSKTNLKKKTESISTLHALPKISEVEMCCP